jgi:OOP family OmpA-OmpF porin
MRNIIMVLLLGLLMLVLATPGFADNQKGTYYVDPFTGFYQFDKEQKLDLRSYYGLRGGYNFTEHVGLEAMFGYIPTETDSMAYANREVRVMRYGLDALYNFNPESNLVPFIAVGLGGTQTKNTSAGMPDYSRALFDYGLGLKYFITDAVALRGDVKQALFSHGGNIRNNIELTFGLTFVLGSEKKAIAAIPPVADAVAPEVVCTNPGSNVTGWAIDKNVTATFSEEMDRSTITTSTFTVKKGTTPVIGKVTFAGTTATFSPDGDLEKGTIHTATIVAGVKDRAGNALANNYEWSFTTIPAPKAAAAPLVLIVLEDNHFEFDKSAITKQGADILDDNIQILKTNPKDRILIAGYTSAKGTEEYNQKLSERRAEAVRDYLVKGGIAPERLETIGYGRTRPAEFEPIPNNIYSKEAKANMRVLFEVIVK